MSRLPFAAIAVAAAVACFTCSATFAAPLPAALDQLSRGERADVIVILKDQKDAAPPTRSLRAARAAVLESTQSGVMGRMQQLHVQGIRKFRLINAVSANVSREDAAELATNPSVLAVVPDRIIRQPSVAHATPASFPSSAPGDRLCDTLEPEALQLTNTAFANTAVSQAQTVIDGNGKPVTGRGVKVAFIADGIDPNNKGFIRPDGSKVFIDYQDFSGDGPDAPTSGNEAFGDASAIAAQDMPNGKPLTFDISAQTIPGRLPTPCRIRIRGVAPGASLVGLKIFSALGYTSTSNLIRALEYAVLDADVDVINESLGGEFYPDYTDPVALVNDWAVKAGVTVVASTGDAGPSGTLQDPSSDPAIIAVGATTSFRAYAQIGGLGIEPLLSTGYISNNISAGSSGGFAQKSPRTVDVVAPGDVGWALCSTKVDIYQGCFDANGQPAGFQLFGGTSQSTPFTSGAAALVIQAYRSTHHGADPAPALVKRILMSTATDLGAPAFEQGSGLINTLAAVRAALAVADEHGTPNRRGASVLMQPTSVVITDDPGTSQSAEISLTNTGTSTKHVVPHLETLSKQVAGSTTRLMLAPGAAPATVRRTFIVPSGTDHLDVAIAFQNDIASIALVDLQLFDPQGRLAAYSIPQGVGNGYGHVDVVSPASGTWTAVISTPPATVPVSYSGPVVFSWAGKNWTRFGSVSPASFDLAPGASKSFGVRFRMPADAGDVAAAVRFEGADQDGLRASLPMSLRALIAVDADGGDFAGQLTGGNGRARSAPYQTFAFDVPKGAKNLDLTLDVADSAYALEGVLVDPKGLPLSVQPNLDPSGADPQFGLQLARRDPQPGRWRFILLQNFNSSGDHTSFPFRGHISFEKAHVTASSLPDRASVKLAAGHVLDVPVRITNRGPTTLAYFADARLNTLAIANLQPRTCVFDGPFCSGWILPPLTSGVMFVAHGNRPIGMDAVALSGFNIGVIQSPDLIAREIAPHTVAASLFAPEVPYGPWDEYSSYNGPFGRSGTPTDPIDTSAYILYQPFDTDVSSDHGNKWLDFMTGSSTYNPLVLAPGASGTLHVRITPAASAVGKTVAGNLYIETFNDAAATGDEVIRLPYTYTVVP